MDTENAVGALAPINQGGTSVQDSSSSDAGVGCRVPHEDGKGLGLRALSAEDKARVGQLIKVLAQERREKENCRLQLDVQGARLQDLERERETGRQQERELLSRVSRSLTLLQQYQKELCLARGASDSQVGSLTPAPPTANSGEPSAPPLLATNDHVVPTLRTDVSTASEKSPASSPPSFSDVLNRQTLSKSDIASIDPPIRPQQQTSMEGSDTRRARFRSVINVSPPPSPASSFSEQVGCGSSTTPAFYPRAASDLSSTSQTNSGPPPVARPQPKLATLGVLEPSQLKIMQRYLHIQQGGGAASSVPEVPTRTRERNERRNTGGCMAERAQTCERAGSNTTRPGLLVVTPVPVEDLPCRPPTPTSVPQPALSAPVLGAPRLPHSASLATGDQHSPGRGRAGVRMRRISSTSRDACTRSASPEVRIGASMLSAAPSSPIPTPRRVHSPQATMSPEHLVQSPSNLQGTSVYKNGSFHEIQAFPAARSPNRALEIQACLPRASFRRSSEAIPSVTPSSPNPALRRSNSPRATMTPEPLLQSPSILARSSALRKESVYEIQTAPVARSPNRSLQSQISLPQAALRRSASVDSSKTTRSSWPVSIYDGYYASSMFDVLNSVESALSQGSDSFCSASANTSKGLRNKASGIDPPDLTRLQQQLAELEQRVFGTTDAGPAVAGTHAFLPTPQHLADRNVRIATCVVPPFPVVDFAGLAPPMPHWPSSADSVDLNAPNVETSTPTRRSQDLVFSHLGGSRAGESLTTRNVPEVVPSTPPRRSREFDLGTLGGLWERDLPVTPLRLSGNCPAVLRAPATVTPASAPKLQEIDDVVALLRTVPEAALSGSNEGAAQRRTH